MNKILSRSLMILVYLLAVMTNHLQASPISGKNQVIEGCGQPASLETILSELSLPMAKCIALQKNPSQAETAERSRQASLRVSQAESANSPTIDAGLSWTLSDPAGSGIGLDMSDTAQTTLSASWVVFDGFKRAFVLESAREDLSLYSEDEKDARRSLIGSVGLGYYNAQYYQESIAIAIANQSFQRQQLEAAEIRNKAGVSSDSDILNFQIQLHNARSERITAEQNYQIALMALANLMGISESGVDARLSLKPLKLDGALAPSPPDLEELIAKALNQRPDLKRYTHSIAKVEAAMGEVKAENYPTISLIGSLKNVAGGSNGLDTELGLSISMNLFSGGVTKHKMAELESSRREVESQYQTALLALKTNLSSALIEIEASRNQVILRQQTLTLVRQSRDQARTAYKSGISSYTSVNEAQNELVKAQSLFAQARVSLLIAWEKLRTLTADQLD